MELMAHLAALAMPRTLSIILALCALFAMGTVVHLFGHMKNHYLVPESIAHEERTCRRLRRAGALLVLLAVIPAPALFCRLPDQVAIMAVGKLSPRDRLALEIGLGRISSQSVDQLGDSLRHGRRRLEGIKQLAADDLASEHFANLLACRTNRSAPDQPSSHMTRQGGR